MSCLHAAKYSLEYTITFRVAIHYNNIIKCLRVEDVNEECECLKKVFKPSIELRPNSEIKFPISLAIP